MKSIQNSQSNKQKDTRLKVVTAINLDKIKVALVSHPLHTHGGAEYHLKVLTEIFPKAPIYTLWKKDEFTDIYYGKTKIITSILDKLPLSLRKNRIFYIFYNFLYSRFQFNKYDLVYILSDGFEKNIKLPMTSKSKIILNILTPPRFLWLDTRSTSEQQLNTSSDRYFFKIYKKYFKNILHNRWKKLDKLAAKRANLLIANSDDVAERIELAYGLNSKTIYPPVEIEKHAHIAQSRAPEDWYLYLGRLESYKGVELAIRSAIISGRKLKVAGAGSELNRLKEIVSNLNASKNIEFLGYVDDIKKEELLRRCKALIFPAKDEDFGLIVVEANAAGVPVIAFKGGGVKETILEYESGVFFEKYNEESLVFAINRFEEMQFNSELCLKSARRFDKKVFKNKVRKEVYELTKGSSSRSKIN